MSKYVAVLPQVRKIHC